MMRKFELCFPLESAQEETYLIPDLLPKEEPEDIIWPTEDTVLGFIYRYQVLPSSIISRFIVRMKSYHDRYWRTGVILSYPDQDNKARVTADLEDRKVTISIIGNLATRREFLAIIRHEFDYIHNTIPRIGAKALVPIPGHPDIEEEYEHLLMLEQEREKYFFPRGLRQKINVRQLLDGVEEPKARGVVSGIPDDLLQKLQELLLRCDEYIGAKHIHHLFTTDKISLWDKNLPKHDTIDDQVQGVIYFMHRKYRANTHENGLVLFLQVLSKRINSEDKRHGELFELAKELEPVLQYRD